MTNEEHKEYCRAMCDMAEDTSLPMDIRDKASFRFIVAAMANCRPLFFKNGDLTL